MNDGGEDSFCPLECAQKSQTYLGPNATTWINTAPAAVAAVRGIWLGQDSNANDRDDNFGCGDGEAKYRGRGEMAAIEHYDYTGAWDESKEDDDMTP